MADEEFRLCCGSHCSPEALNPWGLYLTAQLTLDKMQAVPTLGELFLGQCMLEFWFLSADFSSPPLPQRSHLQWGSKAVYTGGYSLLGCKSVPLTLFRGKRQKPSISAFRGKRQKPSDINLCFPEHFCCRPCAGQQTGPRTGQAQVLPLRNVHTTKSYLRWFWFWGPCGCRWEGWHCLEGTPQWTWQLENLPHFPWMELPLQFHRLLLELGENISAS